MNSPILRWLNFKVFVGCALQAKASALLQIQAQSLSDGFAKLTPFDTVVSDRSWGPHPLQKKMVSEEYAKWLAISGNSRLVNYIDNHNDLIRLKMSFM